MGTQNPHTLSARLQKSGKLSSNVKLAELEQKFREFYAAHTPREITESQDIWAKYIELVEVLNYQALFFKFDPEKNVWLAENEAGVGPWVEVDPNDYFNFS